jgi:hypothetical protein
MPRPWGMSEWLALWAVGFALGSFAGGILILAAVAFYNWTVKRVRASHRVPQPDLAKAMGIAIIAYLAGQAALYCAGLTVVAPRTRPEWYVLAIAHVVALAVLTGALSIFLPTKLWKAFLVALYTTLLNYLLVWAASLVGIGQ